MTEDKLLALEEYATSSEYDELERVALELADAMTLSDREVSDELFARVSSLLDEAQVVEAVFVIAFENMLSKFHRTLRVDSHGFCPIRPGPAAA